MSCVQIGQPRMPFVFLWHVFVCSTTRFIFWQPATVQLAPTSRQFKAWMSEERQRLMASSRELRYLTRCSCWFALFIMLEIIKGKSIVLEPPCEWKKKTKNFSHKLRSKISLTSRKFLNDVEGSCLHGKFLSLKCRDDEIVKFTSWSDDQVKSLKHKRVMTWIWSNKWDEKCFWESKWWLWEWRRADEKDFEWCGREDSKKPLVSGLVWRWFKFYAVESTTWL